MDKLINIFTDNLQWKITSLVAGIILWFVCITVTNPVSSASEIVELELRNYEVLSENRRLLINEPSLRRKSITVTVRGKASEVSNLKGKLHAYIDFSLFETLTTNQTGVPLWTAVKVDKTGNYDFEITTWSPYEVEVNIDRFIEQMKTVSVNYNGTSVAEGYANAIPVIEPDTVTIKGAQTLVSKVNTVSAAIDLNNNTETFSMLGRLKAYDIEGKELDVEISSPTVSVTVPISKVMKIPVLEPSYIGQPAPGYMVSGIKYDIKQVDVVGAKENMEQVDNIILPSIDIDGQSSDVKKTFRLINYLPHSGLSIVDQTPKECTVTIQIEKLVTKTIEISVSDIEIKGHTNGARIITDKVEIEIEGFQKDIDAVTKLPVTLNLSGLSSGENLVELKLASLSGISVKGPLPKIQVVVDGLNTAAPIDNDSPEPADNETANNENIDNETNDTSIDQTN